MDSTAGSFFINATAEVIIIGAGPVGLTPAIDLAREASRSVCLNRISRVRRVMRNATRSVPAPWKGSGVSVLLMPPTLIETGLEAGYFNH